MIKITKILNGESKKAKPYTMYINNKKIGRAVITKTTRGQFKDYYLLSNVIIYKEFRGKKLCSTMISKICSMYKKVYLKVKKDNIPAVKCYKKVGFKVFSETKFFYIMTNN
jgi:ribosomal protein S18 acetylase RimI-like enzyme